MSIATALTLRRGRGRLHWTDLASYAYLLLGVVLMFGPVLWLGAVVVQDPGRAAGISAEPAAEQPEGSQRAGLRQAAAAVQRHPGGRIDPGPGAGAPDRAAGADDRSGGARARSSGSRSTSASRCARPRSPGPNYTEPLRQFDFLRYLGNSVFVTVVATLITLLINSMAAYALSIYEFPGRNAAMLGIIGTLMIPITIILVPVYLVITWLGLVNNLWAVILPGAATPTGVFLLRQYMLTLPRDLIEAARMDKASEWQIYARIVLPLSLPALAVLAIFSVMWRWNEFLWPLAVLSKSESYTLQIGLNAFQGELQTQWNYLLAMTVITLLPIAVVFVFLQRFIVAGIANTGVK